MTVHNFARCTVLVPFAVCASLLVALPVRGQTPPARSGEIMAVVRISKQLMEDVVSRQEIVASVPYHAKVVGFYCQGVIDGRAKVTVDFRTAKGEATFVFNSKGTAQSYVRGVRGPIVALGPAYGPFTSQTVVRFEGRKFSLVGTTPWADVHGELDSVEGRHGRRVGRAVGRLLRPVGECLLLPHAEAQAVPIAEDILKTFVNEVAEVIITRLDRTTRVEQSMNRLFPKTTDWVFQMSADPHFLQAAYGPRGSKVPVLPENPGRLKDVRLELWLHTTTTEARDLAKLSKLPLARALIDRYLESILPEMAALAENRSVDSVGEWLVISLGAPKAGPTISIFNPDGTLRRFLPGGDRKPGE
jgi:hypothetical protein